MKIFVRQAVLLVAATAMCQAGFARAEDIHWISGDGQWTLVGDQKVVAKEQAPCSSCGQTSCCGESCGSCDPCADMMGCDACPGAGIVGFGGFDAFNGVSESGLASNFGVVTGLNAAMPVPGLSDRGISWQLGMSYGVYDLDGGIRVSDHLAQSQQQIFVTTGFFHKASDDRRLSFGLVYDWMINDQWGLWGTSPTLGQWRGQVEYALSGCNAVGMYGSVRDLGSRQRVALLTYDVVVENRAISQVNLFWHHKFTSGADSWLWVGIPERERLSGVGSLGDWIVGANVQAPLSERLALYGNAQYMHPSEAAGVLGSLESTWNVGMGIVWYFGGHAGSHAINGKCGLPYMPVANNSTFLVDQDPTLGNLLN